jgi:predicted ribosomally synthesized peptide with SipW-like signal peptide
MNGFKRKLALTLVVLVMAIGTWSATLAYFTDAEAKVNTFVVGTIDVDIPEEWEPPEEILPGHIIEKKPKLTGVSGTSYARVVISVTETERGADGELIPIPNNPRISDDRFDRIISTVFLGTRAFITGHYSLPDDDGYEPFIDINEAEISRLMAAGQLFRLPLNAPDAEYTDLTGFVVDPNRTDGNLIYLNYIGGENANTLNTSNRDEFLDPGEEAIPFNRIIIPSDWGKDEFEIIGEDYIISVRAEAIQVVGFEDDREGAYSQLDQDIADGKVP